MSKNEQNMGFLLLWWRSHLRQKLGVTTRKVQVPQLVRSASAAAFASDVLPVPGGPCRRMADAGRRFFEKVPGGRRELSTDAS